MTDSKTFKIGSRKSELALIQTNCVVARLQDLNPDYKFEIVKMNTLGDKILDIPLPKIGEKSLFTKELEEALENGTIDFVVHSLKDLPTTLPLNKVIGAVLEREDPRDCLILHEKHRNLRLKTLPEGSIIGTSSLRRTAQLCKKYPQLKCTSIRGNLNTRLKKLNETGMYDGIMLAVSGITRIGWFDKISEILDENDILYAVGQGALAVECQQQNEEVLSLLKPLNHRETILSVLAERSFLRKLEGGCSAPVAVHSRIKGNTISLTGLVCSLDGSTNVQDTLECNLSSEYVADCYVEYRDEAGEPSRKRTKKLQVFCGISPESVNYSQMELTEQLGIDLANSLISKGALEIMETARKEVKKNIK